MILATISVFIMGVMLVSFFVLKREQSKLDSDTFLFTLDEDKNNYSKKVKFLDQ